MKRCMLKKLVSMMMALAMVITSVSWTDFGTLDAKAASNAPKVEYTFEEISDMANIPVMNLTMADASKLIMIGLLLLAAALCLTGYNIFESK